MAGGSGIGISKGASEDISKLTAGIDRAAVALAALSEESLSPQQAEALLGLARRFGKPSVTTQQQSLDESHAAFVEDARETVTHHAIKTLVTESGGIFIGKDELVTLGKIAADVVIPEIPEKFSQVFLESRHPLRDGSIASHVILAFDLESNQWHCLDRGEGGRSDIIPGSLGKDGGGLIGSKQDELIANVKVEDRTLESPTDSYPAERILDNAIAQHLKDGNKIETSPFYGIWGRTADTERARARCRVLLGHSGYAGAGVDDGYSRDYANEHVGLLAAWN